MSRPPVTEFAVMADGDELYILADGVPIARRGHYGTAEAGTWVSLAPGWRVRDEDYPLRLVIEYDGRVLH